MTDPLDELKRAFDHAAPPPDAARRRANLNRAGELFDQAGESATERHPARGRRVLRADIASGGRHMLSKLIPRTMASRAAFATVAGLAAVGLAFLFLTLGRDAGPHPETVVSDAGIGPRNEASPVDRAGERRPATAPSAGRPSEAGGADTVESATAPEPESADGPTARIDVAPQVVDAGSEALDAPSAPRESESTSLQEALPDAGETSESNAPGSESSVLELMALPSEAEALVAAEPPPEATLPVPAPAGPFFLRRGSLPVVEKMNLSAAGASADVEAWIPLRRENTEEFANEPASPVRVATEHPVSTFSIDVDTASYSMVRSSLQNGMLPFPESVRIEELINYFSYAYPPPEAGDAPFKPTVTVMPTPWNADTLLMQIGIQGRLPATDDRPPLNLVFLIDTSGSMDYPNKLPLLKQSFRLMLSELDAEDEVAIVTYAGSAGRVLDATPATERATILSALDRLEAGGWTAGAEGIQLAYGTAVDMAEDGQVTRVILATDGDFNVGISDPEQLEGFIARQRENGVYLSVLGFGRGNLDDATMQALAQNGNGQAAYIDTLSEARKVLVDQLVGTLFPLANDVKIQVEFNPAAVAEYRLIGYETRALRREDFNNDRVDAGEIGAGHAVTAIYEVTPAGSPAVLHEPLRYADRAAAPADAAERRGSFRELAFLRLRYKAPGEDESRLIERPITRDAGEGDEDQRFAAAIAGFGQLLRNSVYTGDWTWADAIALAAANTGSDPFGYRREAATLMRLAESLAGSLPE